MEAINTAIGRLMTRKEGRIERMSSQRSAGLLFD
jgi:hypothetical protein